MEIIEVKNLKFKYPTSDKYTIDDVSFTLEEGSFVIIAGPSGSGKTTLLKLLKKEIAPSGSVSGSICFKSSLQEKNDEELPFNIGYVMQNPESQIVTDKVYHELAFGLENLGLPNKVIMRRVSEVASFFGLERWFRSNTADLSGGTKQLINLASIIAMQPKVLLLDEPTSQLDPIAASEFIATLKRVNEELGITILLVEHRLDEVYQKADKIIIMNNGKIVANDDVFSVGNKLINNKDLELIEGLPVALKIYSRLENSISDCPITISQCQNYLRKYNNKITYNEQSFSIPKREQAPSVEVSNLWFRYNKKEDDVLRGISFKAYPNEVHSLLGGNGVGKSTLLKLLANIITPYSGTIKINQENILKYKGKELYHNLLAYLPQNTEELFIKQTIEEDIFEVAKAHGLSKEQFQDKLQLITKQVGININPLLKRHPYDLSGGEKQKIGFVKVLMLEPKIILLDEPTKGMDSYSKKQLSLIINNLKNQGLTIIIVTHDIEFASSNSDVVSMLFDGVIISTDEAHLFFYNNHFYTTMANRISRGHFDYCVSANEIIDLCLANGKKNE